MDNTLKQIWADGETAVGAWCGLPDTISAELLGRVGFDYICVDTQHGLSDYSTTLAILQTLEPCPATTIVRVPWNEPGVIGRTLDAGAQGIIVPMVNSPEEAEAAVRACRYAPDGARSWGPMRIAGLYDSYTTDGANEMVACIPMIETAQAVDAIDEILSVPGIDAIYVGPADLSITLGQPPRGDNDGDFAEAIARILEACADHDVVPGIHANPDLYAKRAEQGFKMITVCNDTQALATGARQMLDDARSGLGGTTSLY
jgi:4-hydroxy-2-oxoheptanedioate aldolase